MNKKISKNPFQENNELFFKVPLELQQHMSSMSSSEIVVYIFFMTQVFYKRTLEIEEPVDSISYWTGIKNPITVRSAIRGLVKYGWIKDIVYRKNSSNIYVLNLRPEVNYELIRKMDDRSKNTSTAKKKSIQNGEGGKFVKKNVQEGESTEEQQ